MPFLRSGVRREPSYKLILMAERFECTTVVFVSIISLYSFL